MAIRKDRTVLRQIETLFNVGAIRELTDGQLLERFATGGGEAGEQAFAALVERHGPMVLRVCRAQLSDPHDTQDAYQATFLVLVVKARSLWVRETLGPWLHQVAFRTASCTRAASARRRKHEGRAAELVPTWKDDNSASDRSREQVLHAEINRLPDRYRVPIVLCDLEGLTNEEAARRMGRPVGTVKSWRCRGREQLRRRLLRSSLAPTAGLGASLPADRAWSAVLNAELEALVRTGVGTLSHCSNAGVVPATVRALVKGVLRAMFISKLRTTASLVFVLAVFAAGFGATALVAAGDPEDAVPPAHGAAPPASGSQERTANEVLDADVKELVETPWSLTLREAISIGLDNAETMRIISRSRDHSPGVIWEVAPNQAGGDPQRFRAEVMAKVRSVEQLYWSLAQQHVHLWSTKNAVELVEEIVKRERSELEAGRGTGADVAESRQRLEGLQLEMVVKASDVKTTEGQLRNILGLPPEDGRRIVPVTRPVDEKVLPDWETCLATMLKNHPEVARVKAAGEAGAAAELDAVAMVFLPALGGRNGLAPASTAAQDRRARLEGEKAGLQQVIHQATHDLARYYGMVEMGYKQYQAASEARATAARRLEAQRAFYDEGRITIDRYLDAISQYASSIAQEAQHKATYNIALLGLEEAKGTLLRRDKIVVIEAQGRRVAADLGVTLLQRDKTVVTEKPPVGASLAAKGDPAMKYASAAAPIAAPAALPPIGRTEPPPVEPVDEGGKTVEFQMTIGRGPRPLEIRGSFTVKPAVSGGDSTPR